MIELLLAVSIFACVIAISVNLISVHHTKAVQSAECLSTGLTQIESALKLFSAAKGALPSSSCTMPAPVNSSCLSNLVPDWLKVPPGAGSCLEGLQQSFYYYSKNGETYLCVKANTPSQSILDVFSEVQKKQPDGKVFINATCGATSNNTANGKCLTWWIVR